MEKPGHDRGGDKKRRWDPRFFRDLKGVNQGDSIRFELVAGEFASGEIHCLKRTKEGVAYVSGELSQPERGRFFFQKQALPGVAGDFIGVVEFPASKKAYRIETSGPNKELELVQRDLGEVVCINLPRPDSGPTSAKPQIAPLNPGAFPDLPIPPYQKGIIVLESFHGAVAVVYLDFQGGTTTTWGGQSYDRPDVSNEQIRDVWRRVAEDFMPFNINVTTDLMVYERAPENSRQRVIITPSSFVGAEFGGIAYFGSFNWTGDTPCWVFLTSGKPCAEACSHEIGHTLGLNHAGLYFPSNGTFSEYFYGHGDGETGWGPIMGISYSQNVSQWSKGEYLGADNSYDQLSIITTINNNVAYRADDTGDTLKSSRYLELYPDYTAAAEGVIERTADTDAFQFTTGGGEVALQAEPVPASPNLALEVSLYDANDQLLAHENPQTALGAALVTNVPPGTYTFRVTGAGRNDPLTNGFSNYASLGYYSVTGAVANARLPDRFEVAQHATNGTSVGLIKPVITTGDPLVFEITGGNLNGTFALDGSGRLSVANDSGLDYVTLGKNTQLPVQFELFVDIIDAAEASLSETNRRVVVAVLYVPTPPVITQQPRSQSMEAGREVAFNVVADHAAPFDTPAFLYQWFFNGKLLPGANTESLTLSNVQANASGDFWVTVSTSVGSITSSVATLTVLPSAPFLTAAPRSQGIFPGLSAGFSVAAAGTEPFAYQWQLNGRDIEGATNSFYSIRQGTVADEGVYRVFVYNAVGSASAEALLARVPVAAWGWGDSGQTNLPIELTNAVMIAAGGKYNLALKRDSTVLSWGAMDQSSVPPMLSNAVAVAAGYSHSLALKLDGTVRAWGDNSANQLTVPANLTNAVAIAAGAWHSLALRSDNSVVAWGSSSNGQTVVPPGLTNIVAIAAGNNHSVALRSDGKVFAWGDNSFGQTQVPKDLTDVVAIAAGSEHTLALRLDGTVAAWGNPDSERIKVPNDVTNVLAIAAGSAHSLALGADGSVAGWGAGQTNTGVYPQLGQSIVPPTVRHVTAIAGGAAHSLAFSGNGAPFISEPPIAHTAYTGRQVVFRAAATGTMPLAYRWQFNGSDIPDATNRLLVIDVASADKVGNYRVVVTNEFGTATSGEAKLTLVSQPPFLLAQPASQTIYLGGQAQFQVTADGSGPLLYQWRLNAADLPGATNATLTWDHVKIQQGGNYSVIVSSPFGVVSSAKAQLDIIQVVAWGLRNAPQYANGGQDDVPIGLNGVVRVAGGGYHTLALKADGTVVAWGAKNDFFRNDYGQTAVPGGLTDVIDVAAGTFHSLALKGDGTVVAWGAGMTNANSGLTYDWGQSIVPASLRHVVAIAAGAFHSVALTSDGQVVVWGGPSLLGPPSGVENIVAIASKGSTIAALKPDGTLFRWGYSSPRSSSVIPNAVAIAETGQSCLALRSDGRVTSPDNPGSSLLGLTNVTELAAGYFHWLVLKQNNTLTTWGSTNTGDLGRIPAGMNSVLDVAAGDYHSLAALGDGSVVLTRPPPNRVCFVGSQTLLSAAAGGLQPLSYQWQFNEASLPGATNAWLRLRNLQFSDAGAYRVVVGNAFGAVTSKVAVVSVLLPAFGGSTSGLTWSSGGDATWFGETNVVRHSSPAAQSAAIADGEHSSLQTTVSGPGTLTFWWKVSSEQWFDYLSFSIDGVKQEAISGEVDWQPQSFDVSLGTHTLSWAYSKDASGSGGLDAGWLDDILFVTNPPFITAQPVGQTVSLGGKISLSVTAYGAPPLTFQWIKNGTNLPGSMSSVMVLPKPTRHDSASYSVQVMNPGGATLSSNAWVQVRMPQQLASPSWLPGKGLFLISSDADGASLWPDDLVGFKAQTSTNLSDWIPLAESPTLTNGTLLLMDPEATNYPTRFYRIIEQ